MREMGKSRNKRWGNGNAPVQPLPLPQPLYGVVPPAVPPSRGCKLPGLLQVSVLKGFRMSVSIVSRTQGKSCASLNGQNYTSALPSRQILEKADYK